MPAKANYWFRFLLRVLSLTLTASMAKSNKNDALCFVMTIHHCKKKTGTQQLASRLNTVLQSTPETTPGHDLLTSDTDHQYWHMACQISKCFSCIALSEISPLNTPEGCCGLGPWTPNSFCEDLDTEDAEREGSTASTSDAPCDEVFSMGDE